MIELHRVGSATNGATHYTLLVSCSVSVVVTQSSTPCQQTFPWCTVCLVWLALGAKKIPYGATPPGIYQCKSCIYDGQRGICCNLLNNSLKIHQIFWQKWDTPVYLTPLSLGFPPFPHLYSTLINFLFNQTKDGSQGHDLVLTLKKSK